VSADPETTRALLQWLEFARELGVEAFPAPPGLLRKDPGEAMKAVRKTPTPTSKPPASARMQLPKPVALAAGHPSLSLVLLTPQFT